LRIISAYGEGGMNIFLFGTGGHAKVVADIVEREARHRIVGLVSCDGEATGDVRGYEVVASNDDFHEKVEQFEVEGCIIGLGDNAIRKALAKRTRPYLAPVVAVHPSAVVGRDCSIGAGTVLMPGAIVNASTVIGEHCILNTAALVDHDCRLGNFVHVCPGACLTGHVNVGDGSVLGAGCCVRDHISLGREVTVGMGAVVTSEVGDGQTVMGVPARPSMGDSSA
jgi:sugar O-acyltransferase (sialic acid O-acetyltransferase NeuD family)